VGSVRSCRQIRERPFHFDEEVPIPMSQFGSRFRIGPLTGDDSRVRVHIVHFPPFVVRWRQRPEVEQPHRDVKILDIGEGIQHLQHLVVARQLFGLPCDR
jgi:hypothetical protein